MKTWKIDDQHYGAEYPDGLKVEVILKNMVSYDVESFAIWTDHLFEQGLYNKSFGNVFYQYRIIDFYIPLKKHRLGIISNPRSNVL